MTTFSSHTTDSHKTERRDTTDQNYQDRPGAVPPWAAGTSERMHELDPELSSDEMDILKTYGAIKSFSAGELLWSAGERGSMFAVLDGGIDVYRQTCDGEQIIISHGPGHYVGETITMSGGRALVSGRATKAALTAVVIESKNLRSLIATESDLGEKLLLSFILRRMRMIAENLGNVELLGNLGDSTTAGLQSFLSRNGVPFKVIDLASEEDKAQAYLRRHEIAKDELPVVICNDNVLKKPSTREVAECLGFTAEIDCGATYDLAIVGSGPAGLASAVYAASEGLDVVVLEQCAPGGQAGSSSKIENYMGFPTGISGQALMGRGYLQAQKFGAQIAVAREMQALECGDEHHKLRIDGGDTLFARSVIIASGAVYRQPKIDGLERYGGVHYGASHVEAQMCRSKDVAVIGGGNSAGQAAVYLSQHANNVHIFIRGDSLVSSMSDYLIQRINRLPNVHLHTHKEIVAVSGESAIEAVKVYDNQQNSHEMMDVSHLFVFIGAKAGTDFVKDSVALDDNGFVLTGDAIPKAVLEAQGWDQARAPYLLETSRPRVFAVGDVRSGSIKRVASAVGEGSVCVQFVHAALADLK